MKKLSRLTALLLVLLMTISAPVSALASSITYTEYQETLQDVSDAVNQPSVPAEEESQSTVTVTVPGESIERPVVEEVLAEGADSSFTLPLAGKLVLSVAAAAESYQWQIRVDGVWANIVGETGASVTLTYAMLENALSGGTAVVRCSLNGESFSPEALITVDFTDPVTSAETEKSIAVTSFYGETPVNNARAMYLADDAANEANTNYSVVINYVFESGETAAAPYTASIAAGTHLKTTVKNPAVQGYVATKGESTHWDNGLSFDGENDQVTVNIESISENIEVSVVYQPTEVDYTVIHHKQNVDDDKYTLDVKETRQGLTNSIVPDVAKTYEGFYALLYEKPAIAAEGSTEVNVYYDRYYYLMNFDLDGGYGVEPIYARYEAPIVDIGTPTKAGYTFKGWSLDGTNAVELPTTMPAENSTYKALWEAGETAKVSIVIWGENADDEGYSYIDSSEIYAKPGDTISYDSTIGLNCEKEVHQHTDECYQQTCTTPEHDHATAKCVLSCSHTSHTVDCYTVGGYAYSLKETTKPSVNLTDAGNGIWTYTTTSGGGWGGSRTETHYYVEIGGTWYCAGRDGWWDDIEYSDTQKITFSCTHVHSDSCYSCGLVEHSHSDSCYALVCGKEEHSHGSSCCTNWDVTGLESNLWLYVRSDEVTVAADGSTVMNVYFDRTEFTLTFEDDNSMVYTIKEKWGADISDHWPIKGTNGTTYDSGERWQPSGSDTYKQVLVYLSVMPAENFTLTCDQQDYDTYIMHYMVEALPGETGTSYDGKTFKESFKVTAKYNFVTKAEDFFDLDGFSQWASNPSFQNGKIDIRNGGDVYFYYTRNSYVLTFNDGYTNVKTESVKYQAPLSTYASYVPNVPSAYEPDSVIFGGWYLNPECTGAEYKLSEHIMPAKNVLLYAKWVPVTHTVKFYMDQDAYKKGTELNTHPDLTVPHGSKLDHAPEDPTNGSYTFVGWFYMDGDTEKAFDFANMPVNKDLKVYGKWSSNVLKNYEVFYKVRNNDGTTTDVAAPTVGSGLAGTTKTFETKGGADLYYGYQEGYFPVVKSHSLTIDIKNEANNTFTFWYVQTEAVPYTVKYLDKETGESVVNDKIVSDNRKAVVTETFVPVSGYLPDAYQKRLVVSVDEDGNPDTEHNVIIFYYTKDDKHAYYKITHYTQDTDGESWTEYASSQAIGDIGDTYSAEPMTISGFTYDETVKGTLASGKLTENGLELKLYYTRKSYPYEVRYLEQGTDRQLADSKTGLALYDKMISESAITIANYTAVEPTSKTLTIKIEEGEEAKLNVITFYYRENEATINYKVVGPEGCGMVTTASETLKVLSGNAQGSTATAKENYRFVGWYKDEACTESVDTSWVYENNKLIPQKVDHDKDADTVDIHVAATYYARFEYNLTSLTIAKTIDGTVEQDACFVFNVSGNGLDLDVTINGAGSVTIYGLIVGNTYTVKEVTGNWRYTLDANGENVTMKPSGNGVSFSNNHETNKWLDDNAYSENTFNAVGGMTEGGGQ